MNEWLYSLSTCGLQQGPIVLSWRCDSPGSPTVLCRTEYSPRQDKGVRVLGVSGYVSTSMDVWNGETVGAIVSRETVGATRECHRDGAFPSLPGFRRLAVAAETIFGRQDSRSTAHEACGLSCLTTPSRMLSREAGKPGKEHRQRPVQGSPICRPAAQPHGFRAAIRFGPSARHPTTATRPTPGLTRKARSATLGSQTVTPSGSQPPLFFWTKHTSTLLNCSSLVAWCFLLDIMSRIFNRPAAEPCIPPARCITNHRSCPSSNGTSRRDKHQKPTTTKPASSDEHRVPDICLANGVAAPALYHVTTQIIVLTTTAAVCFQPANLLL